MESIPGSRVLMIFTYRPEFVHTWGSRSFHSQLTLNRLSNRESLTMLADLLGSDNIAPDLQDLILEKTEGVPFFIEEFVRSLRDMGIIERTDYTVPFAQRHGSPDHSFHDPGCDHGQGGFIADASGIGATMYKAQKAAIDLFIEEANASGGVLGRPLELAVRDAELKPDIGAAMARELILNEKCDFLIGGTSSAVALAVTKVAREFKKIIYFHTSNSEALTTTDFQPYMFQVVPNTGIEARGIAMFLAQKPYKRFSYIGPDYAYGRSQWEIFKAELSKRNPGAEIQEPVWTKVGETDYSPYIPMLIAKNPEIIFSSLWGGSLSSFIKQAAPTGLFNKASITGLFDLDLLRSMGMDMPEGLLAYPRCPFYAIRSEK